MFWALLLLGCSLSKISGEPEVNIPGLTTFIGAWDQTEQGESFKSFKGIQFGKVNRRFQEATTFKDYGTETAAQEEGSRCPQLPLESDMTEECLFLNIYTPAVVNNVTSVMVYIHGGALITGSGGQRYYGPQFILDYDVIMVSINYRLGPLGFLSLDNDVMSGNIGFRDQILALEWIQRNIAYFGGNAEDITIFGESAGSWSVMYQVLSPLSRGLFTKAIAQSGAPFSTMRHSSREGKNRMVALSLAKYFDCDMTSDNSIFECLEGQSVESMLNANYLCVDGSYICTYDPWDAVVDTWSDRPFLPNLPDQLVINGEYNKVPMIIGVNAEEGIISAAQYIYDPSKFVLFNEYWSYTGPLFLFDTETPTPGQQDQAQLIRQFYLGDDDASMDNIHDVIDFYSDSVFWHASHRFTLRASNEEDIFTYQLTYKSKNSYADIGLGLDSEALGLGVCHADDIFHIFKTQYGLSFSESDLVVRDLFLTWWTNFAKTGKPTADDSWRPFKPMEPAYMEIKPDPEMAYSDRYRQRMDFWAELLED